jgi:hypothetical protein
VDIDSFNNLKYTTSHLELLVGNGLLVFSFNGEFGLNDRQFLIDVLRAKGYSSDNNLPKVIDVPNSDYIVYLNSKNR